MQVLLRWNGVKTHGKHADGSFDYDKIEQQTKNAIQIISALRK